MSYEINLHFPHVDWTVQMPAVPRKGDRVEFADPDIGDTSWDVTEVTYTAYTDGTEGSINLALDPADEATKKRSDEFEANRLDALRSARVNELRKSIRNNRPEPLDDAPLRDARARQEAAMRANQEPTDRATEQ
ncbi:hypothetical protein [Streptomyces sp. NPDC058295]|uniref:hypothetical protein n=1 Tax=Streptomyces sp. NPDC058295 TaxID=3346431 RepID=UPI0036E4374F